MVLAFISLKASSLNKGTNNMACKRLFHVLLAQTAFEAWEELKSSSGDNFTSMATITWASFALGYHQNETQYLFLPAFWYFYFSLDLLLWNFSLFSIFHQNHKMYSHSSLTNFFRWRLDPSFVGLPSVHGFSSILQNSKGVPFCHPSTVPPQNLGLQRLWEAPSLLYLERMGVPFLVELSSHTLLVLTPKSLKQSSQAAVSVHLQRTPTNSNSG